MTTVEPGSRWVRAPEVRLRLGRDGVWIDLGAGDGLVCDPRALTVLELFEHPHSLAEAAELLVGDPGQGAQAWMEGMDLVMGLVRHGVLRPIDTSAAGSVDKTPAETPAESPAELASGGYGAAPVHVAMLEDRARTGAFLRAVRATVQPGDVVVDLGTGTGVLAVAAARAGARRVHAIEASPMGELARQVFEANGVADRVELVRGRSTRVELTEPADLLVSEMVGTDPFDEQLLELVRDARRRLLRPDGRMVPSAIRLWALPLDVPAEERGRHTFVAEHAERWHRWYDVDFTPLVAAARRRPQRVDRRPQDLRGWPTLGPPVLLAEYDLLAIRDTALEQRAEGILDQPGALGAVLLYFELDLAPGITLSTAPNQATAGNHWRSPLWLAAEPIPITPPRRWRVTYRYRAGDGPPLEWAVSAP